MACSPHAFLFDGLCHLIHCFHDGWVVFLSLAQLVLFAFVVVSEKGMWNKWKSMAYGAYKKHGRLHWYLGQYNGR